MQEALTYNDLLESPWWHQRRKVILKRDGNKCRNCGGTEKLQVHHRQYHKRKRTGEMVLPWEYPDQYLISLCNTCHQAGHIKYKIPVFTI